MSLESGHEAQEPRPNVETNSRKSRFGVAQMALGAVSLTLSLYAVWNIAPMLPVVGPMISRFTEPINLLESAADISKSKKADFATFVDAGGLNTFQSWHGLSISNISTAYNDDGSLSRLTLLIGGTVKWSPSISKWTMDSPSAPPAVVRSVLAKICSSDNWQITGVGGSTSKTLSNGELLCTYNKWNDQSNDLIATLELSAALTGALATSPPTALPVDQESPQTRKYFEIVRSVATLDVSQGLTGLIQKSEECWNKSIDVSSKLGCVAADIAARQVLIAAGQSEPTGYFSLGGIREGATAVAGDGTPTAEIDQTIASLNQIIKGQLDQHLAASPGQAKTADAQKPTSPKPERTLQSPDNLVSPNTRTPEALLGKWVCTIPAKRDQPYGTLHFKKNGMFTHVPGLPDILGKREQTEGSYSATAETIQTENFDIKTKINWTVVASNKKEMVMANQYGLVLGCDKQSSFLD